MKQPIYNPYSSWQRGLNENITKKQIKKIEHRLMNHRPRKSLEWRTPYEVFHEKIALWI